MKRIVVQVSEETADNLRELAARCARENIRRDGYTTYGALRASALMAMLAEDAAGHQAARKRGEFQHGSGFQFSRLRGIIR